jgi:sugar phosphate isomerase/epimerase
MGAHDEAPQLGRETRMIPDTARIPLGVSLHTLDPEQRLATADRLAGSSVKAIELWEPDFDKDERHVAEMRRLLAAAGVEVRTVHAAFGDSLDLSSPNPTVRAAGIQAFRAALDLAVRMQAQIVVAHASAEPIPDEERAARVAEARRSIRTIAEMAGRAGCRIAVELLPRTCLGNTAQELLALLEGVEPSTAGVCLDTNHMMADFAALPDAVRNLGQRLIALHCSDYDGVDERHWPPLRGIIDWPAFLAALQDVGFPGPLNYEATLDGETPVERLAFLEDNYARLVSGIGLLRNP